MVCVCVCACVLPSCRKVRSFLMTGKRGMTGGWRVCVGVLSRLRYLAMLRDGSNTVCSSDSSLSYLAGSFSHVPLRRDTGDRFNALVCAFVHTHTTTHTHTYTHTYTHTHTHTHTHIHKHKHTPQI